MLLLTTTILRCPSERSNELISLWSKCNALRTIYRPSESISPMDIRFCFVVPAQLYQSATRLEQNTATRLNLWAIGYGWWAMGDGLLVIGYWIWAAKPHIRTFTLYALHYKRQRPRLIHHSLSPIPCQRQCFDADAKQMQERYEVARVKTSEEFAEHYISTIGR